MIKLEITPELLSEIETFFGSDVRGIWRKEILEQKNYFLLKEGEDTSYLFDDAAYIYSDKLHDYFERKQKLNKILKND